MKKWFIALATSLVLLMPVAMAQQATTNATSVSSTDLQFKRFGESFQDFVFNVRHILTFSNDAKLELLKERNDEMKSRQQAWLDIKAQALQEFRSGNLTAEEKQAIVSELQGEHKAIIKNHLEMTSETKDIELKAKAHSNTELETKSHEEADIEEQSQLSSGLNLTDSDFFLAIHSNGNTTLTADEAASIVQRDFGFNASQVKTETRGNTTYYVVTGNSTESSGAYSLTKNFEVWVESDTGVVAAVNLGTNIASKVQGHTLVGVGVE
ncbi:MAG: hypothetical protein HYW22_00470 [Candidatus Aenigmarchaeota archaeon]|nr:hypothetical protein [Candidatus Aenigmarchaeota archaeon]